MYKKSIKEILNQKKKIFKKLIVANLESHLIYKVSFVYAIILNSHFVGF